MAHLHQKFDQPYWINWRWPVHRQQGLPKDLFYADGTRADRLEDEAGIRAHGVCFEDAKAACIEHQFDGLLYVPIEEIWFVPMETLLIYEHDYANWRRLGAEIQRRKSW